MTDTTETEQECLEGPENKFPAPENRF